MRVGDGLVFVNVPTIKGDAINVMMTGELKGNFVSSSLLVRRRRKGLLHRVVTRINSSKFLGVRGRMGHSVGTRGTIVSPNKDIICYRRTVGRFGRVKVIMCLRTSCRAVGEEVEGPREEKIILGSNRALGSLCSRQGILFRGCTSIAVDRRNYRVRRAVRGMLSIVRSCSRGGT